MAGNGGLFALSYRVRGAIIVLTLVAIAGGVTATVRTRHRARREATAKWHDAETCLLGGSYGEGMVHGFREQQVRAMSEPVSANRSETAPWPATCATHLQRAIEALGGADEETKRLAVALRAPEASTGHVDALVSGIKAIRERLGLRAEGTKQSSLLTVYTLDEVNTVGRTGECIGKIREPEFRNGTVTFVINETNSARVCVAYPNSVAMRCRVQAAPDGEMPDFRFVGTADDNRVPPLMTHKVRRDFHDVVSPLYDGSTGKIVARVVASGAYAASDGSLTIVGQEVVGGPRIVLVQQPDGTVARTVLSKRLSPYYEQPRDVLLLWSHLIGRLDHEVYDEPNPAAVGRFRIDKRQGLHKLTFEPFDLGSGHEVVIQGACKMNGNVAVATQHKLTWLRDNGSLPPVVISDADFHSPGYLECGKHTAAGGAATSIDLFERWCDLAGCRPRYKLQGDVIGRGHQELQIEASSLIPQTEGNVMLSGSLRLGWVDEKLLLIWKTRRMGIRFRLARPEEFATAPDQILFDDWSAADGYAPTSTVTGLRAFTRGGFALVLIATTRGIFPIRIEANGRVQLASVEVANELRSDPQN